MLDLAGSLADQAQALLQNADSWRDWAAAAVESGGRYGEIYRILATAFWARGDLDRAGDCLRIALDDSPDDPVARSLWEQLEDTRSRSGER